MSQDEGTRKTDSDATEDDQKAGGFSAEERIAMRERAQELKAESSRDARSRKGREAGESDVLAKIAEMPEADRQKAMRIHEIVKANAPMLAPKTWYGMPAYALDGKVICFFQGAKKFDARYATFGFSDNAHLDEGDMWPTSFALTDLTPAGEESIAALVRKAMG